VVQKTAIGRWDCNTRKGSTMDNDKRPAKNVGTTWRSTYGTVTTHQVPKAVRYIYSHGTRLKSRWFPCLGIFEMASIFGEADRFGASQTTIWDEVSPTNPGMLSSIQATWLSVYKHVLKICDTRLEQMM
jgi:hypothetical protein